jgi:hypothetical protein
MTAFIRTPIKETAPEEMLAKSAANVPSPRRLVTPEEYAAAFLLTNGYVNGEIMRLDGAQCFQPK